MARSPAPAATWASARTLWVGVRDGVRGAAHAEEKQSLLPSSWCAWWSVPVAAIAVCLVCKGRIPFGLSAFITLYACAYGEHLHNKFSAFFA